MATKHLVELVRKAAAGMSEGVSADGGYLIQADVVKDVIDRIFQPTSRLYEASRYLVGPSANRIKIPVSADPLQSAPSTGTRAYWQSEAQLINSIGGGAPAMSKAAFNSPTLTLASIVTLVPVTEELCEDVVNLDDLMATRMANATSRLVARDMMFGSNAIGGVADSGTGHQASVSTAVSATPTDAQLKTMFGLLHPSAIGGAKWYVSQAVYALLYATHGTYTTVDVTLGNLTILGLPVVVDPYMTSAPQHICLGNFSGYALAYKDPMLAKSMTLFFLTNQSAFRLVWRVAGAPQTVASICEDGVTRGYFVYPSGS